MMSLLMGISNQAVMMGNLNENATHEDLEKNIIVINHDVLPPSMACKGCQYRIMDFHATGKGLTGFADALLCARFIICHQLPADQGRHRGC